MKKLIGLTGPSSFTTECVEMVEKCLNANFVMLYHNDEDNLNSWLEKCDGIILAGGVDVHPTVYNTNVVNHHNLSKFDLPRDLRELKVIDYCLTKNVPMFGICRGHQLIGLSFGMEFMIDISSSITIHSPQSANIKLLKNEPAHYVELLRPDLFPFESAERSILNNLMGGSAKKRIWVNSFHHQALLYNQQRDYKSAKVEVIGLSPVEIDGKRKQVIELMRGPRWISCQFHPEYDWEVNSPSKDVINIFKDMVKL